MQERRLSRVALEDGAAPVVEDAADLLWIVNQDSVEIHPWLSQKENLNYADLLVFGPRPGLPVALPAAL